MSKNILVVEDDEDITENVRALLESEGYQVSAAPNGRAALETLEGTSPLPSVILLDLMMPVMTGYEFREAQLTNPRIAALPVVLMTADGHIGDKATRLGAAATLRKPFDINELLRVVGRFAI